MPYPNPYMQPQMGMYNPYYQNQYQTPQMQQPMQGQAQQMQQIGHQVQQQPVHGFTYVNGIDGAREYYLPNGSEMPLFDNDRNILYSKTVDQSGRATIEPMRVIPMSDEELAGGCGEYVTQQDLASIYKEIDELRRAIGALQPQPAHAKE